MKLIVNADDFGRSSSRNYAIDYCMRAKICTQASLMVNMPHTDEAAELARQNDYMERVCLHLNLTMGLPLTSAIQSTRLCNRSGEFCAVRPVTYTLMHHMNKKDICAIREECEAQICKFLQYGFSSKHIDSHNWIHLHLPVWTALKPLLEKYHYRSVRPMREGLKKIKVGKRVYKYIPGVLRALYYRDVYYKLRNSGYIKSKWASNLEEFLDWDALSLEEEDWAEVFTHPDCMKDAIIDASWSYRGEQAKNMQYVSEKLKQFINRGTYDNIP